MNRRPWIGRLAALCLLLSVGAAHAQVIDELELRRDGDTAVLSIRMVVPVQYRRSVAAAADDLLQVYYDVVPGREKPHFIDGERRQLGGLGLPLIVVSEDGNGAELSNRKLVIRIDRPARMRARAGRNSQTLDILFDGLTSGTTAPTPPTSAASAPVAASAPAALPGTAASAPAPGPEPASAPATAPELATSANPTEAEIETRAAQLIGQAREALSRNTPQLAIENLNEALNLPPHSRTAEAQALIARARLAAGDASGARREAQSYLQTFPDGAHVADMKRLLDNSGDGAATPAPTPTAKASTPNVRPALVTLTGAWSQYYYGGNSKTLTQLKDTPLEGQVPQVISESTLSGTDQKQVMSSADVNWRSRDAERDLRFSFRDNFTWEGMPDRPSRNRLTALYFDWKELGPGLSARVGRQSGLGGGVLGRFDGVQAGWAFQPKWKINAVAGRPTDDLLDTKRWFAGTSIDAEALLPNLGASLYGIEQRIDGETDRQAMGLDLRYFAPNASVFSQLEYDLSLKGLNIAALQGTYSIEGGTTFNVLLDRRATPMLMLGNALFFADPTLPTMPRTIAELLAYRDLATVRQQIAATTAYATQGLMGFTTPLDAHWQAGADLRLTKVDAIKPVPDILPNGLPSTGNVWSASAQLIGNNLYSERDTHVFNLTVIRGPAYDAWLASYNNLSVPRDGIQLEPSLRLYWQNGPSAVKTTRWTPGLRATWRGGPKWVIEGELSVESGKTTGPTQNENATRFFYYLGYRLEL